MAQTALRLCRAAVSLSSIVFPHSRFTPTAAVTIDSCLSSHIHTPSHLTSFCRHFHSTHRLSLSSASRSFNDVEKIDPDTILFEGCDYKHWLIVMSFGKDPSQHPPPDQMVETYVQTCAKVLGSIEEAKKRIYACSTTTYTGFQVEVDEETSQKFEGLPGVIFVLPDSYIDPVNKEYGGDKYINGDIIPRPPPVQYGRAGRGNRQIDRSRGPYNQQGNPGYSQQGNPGYNQHSYPGYNQHSNPGYNQHGSAPMPPPQHPQQRFTQQQNYPSEQRYGSQHSNPPRENYGSNGQGDRVNSMTNSTHHSGGARESFQSGPGLTSDLHPHQGNYSQVYSHSQGQMSNHLGPQGYTPQGQFNNYQEGHGYRNPQGQIGNGLAGHGGYTPQGQMGVVHDNSNYTSTPGAGAYGHNAGPYGAGPDGSYNQGSGSGFGVGHTPGVENQRYPQTSLEQSNNMDNRNYAPGTQTGFNQGRY